MKQDYFLQLINIIKKTKSPLEEEFISRINQRKISRDENITSHICCFFGAVDKKSKQVFIGSHKKSGLWLFNGGHLDKNELPQETVVREMGEEWGYVPVSEKELKPEHLTIVNFENHVQACKKHFDIWFFILVDKNNFTPDKSLLSLEFHEIKWVDLKEAKKLCHGQYSMTALEYIEKKYFMIKNYIINNPTNWQKDKYYTES